MKRRSFLGLLAGAIAGLALPNLPDLDMAGIECAEFKAGLVGYRGSEFLATGYVYAPYVPYNRTIPGGPMDEVYDRIQRITGSDWRKGINPRYYSKLVIS
jgi:hypothetical protein